MDLKETSIKTDRNLKRHPWEIARLKVVCKFLQAFATKLSNGDKTILDIGCGDGFVSQKLAMRYPKIRFVGIDLGLTDEMIQKIRADNRITNWEIHKSLDETEFNTNSINIVLMLDVLEHIKEDEVFLKILSSSKLLQKNAIFIITAPAFQGLFSQHDRLLSHYRRYNISQLLAVARKGGIIPIEHGYFFLIGLLYRGFRITLEKRFRSCVSRNTDVSKWKGLSLINFLLKHVLLLDFCISRFTNKFGIIIPGLSCYMICQRQEL